MKSGNRWLFFIIGLIVLVVFGYAGYQIGRIIIIRENTVSDLVDTKAPKKKNEKMSLGTFVELEGTPYLMAAVNSQQNNRQSYYDSKAVIVRNYLFVNAKDKSARRLVPTNDFLFINAREVFLQRRDDKIVRSMWYEVVKSDSNNDKRLDNEDKKTIAISDVSGDEYTEIIDEVDRVLGFHQQNSTTLLIFYEFEDREYVGEINMTKGKLVEKQVLPSIR